MELPGVRPWAADPSFCLSSLGAEEQDTDFKVEDCSDISVPESVSRWMDNALESGVVHM